MPSSVWYVGTSDVRQVADWVEVGVSDMTVGQDVPALWNRNNNWSMDSARFSAQQLGWLNSQDDFYVGAPSGPRGVRQSAGSGRVRVRSALPAGFNLYGSGVQAVTDATVPSGTVYTVDGPGVRAQRDPSVASGYTYLIEET